MHGDSHVSTKWCFLTTPNGIEFRRIESIRGGEREEVVIQSAGTKGLTEVRESHVPRKVVGDIAGNLVSSLSKRVKKRERGEGRRSGIEEDTLGIRVIHLSLPGHFDLRRGEKYFGCENVQIARSDSKGGRSLARVGGLDERSEEQRRRRTSKRQLER